MQTTRQTQASSGAKRKGHVAPASISLRLVLCAVSVVVTCVVALVAAPSIASAKSYTMPQVDIQATVEEDGTLRVVERRAFDFLGGFTAVWWTQGSLPSFGAYKVDGVKMGVLPYGESVPDDADLFSLELASVGEVPFQTSWRSAGGPGTMAYAVDQDETTCYLFFDVVNEVMVAEITYCIENAIDIYDDAAELYWKYVAGGWAEDSRNVTCTISLPVPEGQTPIPTETVFAWGHGDLSGTVHFSDNAHRVLYESPSVPAGQWAEARILFPCEWVSNADPRVVSAHRGQSRIDEAMLSFLFKKVAGGKDQVWLDELSQYAKDSPASCRMTVNNWHNKLDKMTNRQGYFELAGEDARNYIYGVATALGVIGVAGSSFGLYPAIFLLIPAAFLVFVAHFAPWRSQKGADVHERCKALKRWLTDFSSLDERPPTDVKVWGEFMVYAYLFGVAGKTIRELRKALPEMMAQEEARLAAESSYTPFYHYYESSSVDHSMSFADKLSSGISRISLAHEPSDGGGGGGGFSSGGSSGGGGGFGGGGGGGAR